ncbi:Thyroglobulin 1 domain containing protein [Trichuris trichiura]|uniref:Thyroglobulin 1 domain containing protein n=1 Tax=Trichuris trichiura TaxID=36087 RepID=A0A077Z3V6_TRITR|nr:Thyroglobulin 1 domain containing protein [Trichuris trichiura]
MPETAFVEDRRTSTVRISEPTERPHEVTEGVGTFAGPLGVTVNHYVIPVVDSQIHLVPSPIGKNVSELIAPLDIDCSGYNVRFKFCFRTHFYPVSLGQFTVENLLNKTWHWPKLAEVCRLFHDYLNCMYQPSLNPMGLCDPFGHSALVIIFQTHFDAQCGMLNAVCERDVATALHLNGQCLSSMLRNVSWASQCVGTLLDFVRIVHYLPINDGHVCQRIRDMHSCISTLDLSGCGEDLQFALAKLKLTGLQAETYLCGKYLLGPVFRWNRRRANDLPFEELGCLEERRRVLRSNVASDRYVPQCNHRGYYNLVQCDYSIGQCWCVDVESGLEQAKSRKPVTEEVVCGGNNPAISVCFVQKAQQLNETDSKQSVPNCLNSGLYAPLQCDFGASECWCVDERTGIELLYTRVYKSPRLPRCNVRSEFSCSWIPPKKRCAPDGSAPKLVLRWFREGWKCVLRPISFCPHESHLPPYTFRFQSDCEEMCLGPYAAKLPVRYVA